MFFLSDRLPRQSVDTPYQPAPKIASRLRGPASPAVVSDQLSVVSKTDLCDAGTNVLDHEQDLLTTEY
jgi:hypothetical protein